MKSRPCTKVALRCRVCEIFFVALYVLRTCDNWRPRGPCGNQSKCCPTRTNGADEENAGIAESRTFPCKLVVVDIDISSSNHSEFWESVDFFTFVGSAPSAFQDEQTFASNCLRWQNAREVFTQKQGQHHDSLIEHHVPLFQEVWMSSAGGRRFDARRREAENTSAQTTKQKPVFRP